MTTLVDLHWPTVEYFYAWSPRSNSTADERLRALAVLNGSRETLDVLAFRAYVRRGAEYVIAVGMDSEEWEFPFQRLLAAQVASENDIDAYLDATLAMPHVGPLNPSLVKYLMKQSQEGTR